MNNTVRCPKCSTANADQAKFCASCGAALQKSCPGCGKSIPITARFCPACGHDSAESQTPPPVLAPAPIQVTDHVVPIATAPERFLPADILSADLEPAESNIASPIHQQKAEHEAAPAPEPAPEAKPDQILAPISVPGPQAEKYSSKKPNHSGLVWIAGAVVAVMVIAGGAYYFYAARPVLPPPTGEAPEGENLPQPPLATANSPIVPPLSVEPTIPVIAAPPEGGSEDAGCTDCGNKPQEDPSLMPYLGRDIRQLALDQEAMNIGRELFHTHCASCHRADGKGQRDVPNLTDNIWLFGGDPESIKWSIVQGRVAEMPGNLVNGQEDAREVSHYVLALASLPHDPQLAALGRAKYLTACSGCHGDTGKGNFKAGFPDLTDNAWRFGSNEASIIDVILRGRKGGMPQFWQLGQAKAHLLAAYVIALADKKPVRNSLGRIQQVPKPTEPVFISKSPQPEATRPAASQIAQPQPHPAPSQQADRPSNPIEALLNREMERFKRCQGKWGKTPECPQGNWNTEEGQGFGF